MANHPHLEDFDLSSLRYIMWGATPVTASVAEVVTERTGVRWLPAYGASEVPVIACNPVQEPDRWRLDTVGVASHLPAWRENSTSMTGAESEKTR